MENMKEMIDNVRERSEEDACLQVIVEIEEFRVHGDQLGHFTLIRLHNFIDGYGATLSLVII